MRTISLPKILTISTALITAASFGIWNAKHSHVDASSHREAPLIANDPLADNTDVYAFRSPDDTNTVTIIANYIPMELPQGGPNYASFGENIRYEIHIDNDATKPGDEITYRFTFFKVNQDPTTFFNIRLGKQNLMTTYLAEKSVDGGHTWSTIVASGIVPPPNIGPRSISNAVVGLGAANYDALINASIASATGGGGETIYCGPADDPFFADIGGVFDIGQTRAGGTGVNAPVDGLACKNVHSIVIKAPIATLQKNGLGIGSAVNILDPAFVIGVWASASRQQITTFDTLTGQNTYSGNWVQVSRLGMPLTNEVVIPIASKDRWNTLTPYTEDTAMEIYFCRPELALYMDSGPNGFGAAVPALANLRIQRRSLGAYGFCDDQVGLYPLKATNGGAGTALDTNQFGDILLQGNNRPRSVDLLPIFWTGAPNEAPYQLATGKGGNPLANGKPFINNFLPTLGDELRLNMAVPVTSRASADFSSMGLIQAAVLGLTDPRFDGSAAMQVIPNMDGFPNGRRLEDDVVRIELQAVSGAVLAAIGLWYDDYPGHGSPVTPGLLNVLGYTTGVDQNDTLFKPAFPYVQAPWSGYGRCGGPAALQLTTGVAPISDLNMNTPLSAMVQNYPNPFKNQTTFKYRVAEAGHVSIDIYDLTGKLVANVVNGSKTEGTYEVTWNQNNLAAGTYIAALSFNSSILQSMKISIVK
jgi:hypothetical protein